jgi:hypothetical protein
MELKVKNSLCLIEHHNMRTYGGVIVYLHAFFFAIDGGEYPVSYHSSFTPKKSSLGRHWIEDLVEPPEQALTL